MNDELKNSIQLILGLLKEVLVKNGVSIAIDNKKRELMFFNTNTYKHCGKLDGLKISLDDLVGVENEVSES